MKKIAAVILVLFVLALFHDTPIAAGYSSIAKTKVQEVNVHGRYSMMLPTYLIQGYDLNYEASLQYQNIYKEVYVIVIDEPKQEFIDVFKELGEYDSTSTVLQNYSHAQMNSIQGNMSAITAESKMRTLKTQSGDGMVFDVAGTQTGITDAMGFTTAFVEGKQLLYMIMTWTFEKSKSTYQQDMDAMIMSFKELSGAIDTFPIHVQNNKFSIDLPRDMLQDSAWIEPIVASYSSSDGSLYVSVVQVSKTPWEEGYKTWESKKTATLLDYYTMDQRNFMSSGTAKGTETSEIVYGNANGKPWRAFTITLPPDENGGRWRTENRTFEGKEHFYVVQVQLPLNSLKAREQDIKNIYESFKVF